MTQLSAWFEWLTDTRSNRFVVFTTPGVARTFLRCTSCSRIVMHYWVCKGLSDPGRNGCPCGGVHVRSTRIPEWRAAYYVLSRLVWRKWLLKRTYWDPRMPERQVTLDA